MYQLLPIKEPTLFNKHPIQSVMNLKTGWAIPFDGANSDYQEYLKWVAAGNTPEPADEA